MIFKPPNLRKLDGFIDILDAMQHDPLRLEVTASRPGKRTEPGMGGMCVKKPFMWDTCERFV